MESVLGQSKDLRLEMLDLRHRIQRATDLHLQLYPRDTDSAAAVTAPLPVAHPIPNAASPKIAPFTSDTTLNLAAAIERANSIAIANAIERALSRNVGASHLSVLADGADVSMDQSTPLSSTMISQVVFLSLHMCSSLPGFLATNRSPYVVNLTAIWMPCLHEVQHLNSYTNL